MANGRGGGIRYLPSGLEPIAQGIGAIGAALGQNLFLDEQRQIRLQDQIAEDPALAGQYAAQIRRAGGPEQAAQALGLDVEFLRGVEASSPPDFQEMVETGLRDDPASVPAFVQAKIKEAEAVGAEAEAREAVAIGTETYQRTLQEIGVNDARAHLEALGVDLQTDQGKFALGQFENYAEFVQQLPESQRPRFAWSMFNPKFLQDQQFREELSLRDHIAHLQARASASGFGSLDPGELFGLYTKFQDQSSKAIDDLMSATQTGDKELIRVAESRVNDLMRAAQQYLPPGLAGTVFEATPRGKKTRFNIFDIGSISPEEKALMAIQTGEASRTDLFSSAYWKGLNEEKRSQIVNQMSQLESVADLDIMEGWRRVLHNSFLGNIVEGLQGIAQEGPRTPEGRGRVY